MFQHGHLAVARSVVHAVPRSSGFDGGVWPSEGHGTSGKHWPGHTIPDTAGHSENGQAKVSWGSVRPLTLDFLLRARAVFVQVVYCVLDSADLLGLLIANLYVELFLEGHDEFDEIQRV